MKKSPFKRILWILLAAVFGVCVSLALSAHALMTSHYKLSSEKITSPFRVVQITDLHNSLFGENNQRLADRIKAEEPDVILITGDLLNQNEERTDIAEGLIRQLCSIAPVYVSLGNHEVGYQRRFGTDIRRRYSDAGAVVLEYEWTDIEVNGQDLRLGGIYGYCLPEELLSTGEARTAECDYLNAFQNTGSCTILMCHMPVCWIKNGSLDAWDVDFVFSGHDHGGQVRIPIVGGLWAPDQGWFPGADSGLYTAEDGSSTLILSRGLGNTEEYPRFNNIPEIVTVDFLPSGGE